MVDPLALAVWRRRKPAHRGETMIALRSRREALHIAEEFARPLIKLPPPPPPPQMLVVTEWWPDDSIYYCPSINFFEPIPPEPAPHWFTWLFVACLILTPTLAFLLIKLLG